MVLWEENEEPTIEERVVAELLSGRWPVLTVQDEVSEECTRG